MTPEKRDTRIAALKAVYLQETDPARRAEIDAEIAQLTRGETPTTRREAAHIMGKWR